MGAQRADTRRGQGQRPRGEHAGLGGRQQCPGRSGQQSGCGLGMRTCGPPQGPLCLGGARAGSLAGPGAAEAPGGSRGAGGRRTCLPGSRVPTGLPAPLPTLPRSPLGLAAGFRMVQTKRRSRNRVRCPSLRQAARPDATLLVRNVRQRLPPARPDPTSGSASGRRHRGPRPEGDEGPRWEPVYLRDQREQRLLHRTSFDLQSRVVGEARRAGAPNAGRAQRGGHGPRPVAQPGRRPPASTPAAAAKQPRRPRPRPQPSRAPPPDGHAPTRSSLGSALQPRCVCPTSPLRLAPARTDHTRHLRASKGCVASYRDEDNHL